MSPERATRIRTSRKSGEPAIGITAVRELEAMDATKRVSPEISMKTS